MGTRLTLRAIGADVGEGDGDLLPDRRNVAVRCFVLDGRRAGYSAVTAWQCRRSGSPPTDTRRPSHRGGSFPAQGRIELGHPDGRSVCSLRRLDCARTSGRRLSGGMLIAPGRAVVVQHRVADGVAYSIPEDGEGATTRAAHYQSDGCARRSLGPIQIRPFPNGLLPIQVGDDPPGPDGPRTMNLMGRTALAGDGAGQRPRRAHRQRAPEVEAADVPRWLQHRSTRISALALRPTRSTGARRRRPRCAHTSMPFSHWGMVATWP